MKNDTTKYLTRDFLDKERLMILSVTRRCNLSCLYCRRKKGEWYDVLSQNSKNIDLPKEYWSKLLELYERFNVGEIMLTGGEPMEYPLIKEMAAFLNAHKIRFSFHTNGLSKRCDYMLKFLSISNAKPDIHLSIELFEKLQKSLRGSRHPISFIHAALKSGLSIELKVTMHKMIFPYLDDIQNNLHSWVNKGIKSIRFQPIVPTGNNFLNSLLLDKSFIPFLEKLKWMKLNDAILRDIIRNSPQSFDATIAMLEGRKPSKDLIDKCAAKDKILMINTDFEIFNCKTLWGKKNDGSCSDIFDMICCGFMK